MTARAKAAISFMFEVYYHPPTNPTREATLTERVRSYGGRLDYREDVKADGAHSICLTYEFEEYGAALAAADGLRQLGEHVEGPVDYGD